MGFEYNVGKMYPVEILLADDDLINQKVLLKMLESIGYSADLAINGINALECFKRKFYELILMDIRMPHMDGIEAGKRIKSIYGNNSPVIIAVTADVFEGAREKYLACGMDDYIGKPIERNEFQNTILKWAREIHNKITVKKVPHA